MRIIKDCDIKFINDDKNTWAKPSAYLINFSLLFT